jgi:hypothetical protein
MGKKITSLLLSVFIILFFIILVSADSSDSSDFSEWKSSGRSTTNNRYYPYGVSANISTLQVRNYTLPGAITTGVSIANGFLYFGNGVGKTLFQMNLSNLTQQIANFTSASTLAYFPAVANGYVYFASGNCLYQVNATNVRQQIANFTAATTVTSPIIVGDSVYINSGVRVHRLNSTNINHQISNYTSVNTLIENPAYSNGFIYITEGGTTYATRQLNSSTLTQLTSRSSGGRYVDSPAVVSANSVYACTTRFLMQLNATNISSGSLNSYTFNPSSSYDCYVAPAVANGYVYFASTNPSRIWQVNETNVSQLIGFYNIGSAYYSNWIVATNTSVFTGSSDGKLYQFNSNNISRLTGLYNLGTSIVGPTIVNGRLFFSKQTTLLYEINATNDIFTSDNSYPIFSNYLDNNGSINDSGTALFNVSVTNTNGSVLLEINNTNTTALLVAGIYSAQFTLSSPGTYSYRWLSWGNGSSALFNSSIMRYYNIIDSCIPSLTNTSWTEWQNQGSCKVDDLQLQNRSMVQYDINTCNEINNQTINAYQNISCNYCSYNITNSTWTDWTNHTCLIDNTMNQSRTSVEYDSNRISCYTVTNLSTDLWNSGNNITHREYRNVLSCIYQAPISIYLTYPDNTSLIDSDNFNMTFNCSANSTTSISNISLYLSDSFNQNYKLNKTTNLSGQSNSTNWTIGLGSGNYTWNCLGEDTSGNRITSNVNRTIYIGIIDNDNDGIRNRDDKINGNGSDLISQGISNLSLIIGNRTNFTTLNDTQELRFYDNGELLMNFSHNFSISSLDLKIVELDKGNDYLIVNLSNQLQGKYNKTIYFLDKNYSSLCVKDFEISSINNISLDCNNPHETNISDCIGNLTDVSFGNIICRKIGEYYAISNLEHSAVKGTSTVASSQGSIFSRGSKKDKLECTINKDCNKDYVCYTNACVKLFDVKILKIQSPITQREFFNFTYYIKGMAKIEGDVIIKFWLERNNISVTEGKDTIYLGTFEEKTESNVLFLPSTIEDGVYRFYVEVNFENYMAESYKDIEVINTEDGLEIKEINYSPEEEKNTWTLLQIFIYSMFGILIILLSTATLIRNPKKEEVFYQSITTTSNNNQLENESSIKNRIKKLNLILYTKLSNLISQLREKGEKLDTSKTSLSGLIGSKTYTLSGNYIGDLEEIYIEEKEIKEWLVNLTPQLKEVMQKRAALFNNRHITPDMNSLLLDESTSTYFDNLLN